MTTPNSIAASVRRADPDRYLAALFAPAQRRPALLTLYAFNHELARAPEAAREPGLALIRLQWWREVVEGAPRAHEVATPLAACLAAGELRAPELLAMIEAREREVSAPFATVAEWRCWLVRGAGSLAVAAGQALGACRSQEPRLRALGAGYGVAGLLRSVPTMARQGRCLLPADILAACGLSKEAVIADPCAAGLIAARDALTHTGSGLLGRPEPWRRAVIAAALPAVLARRDLRRQGLGGPRGTVDRLAVIAAALIQRA